MTNEKQSNNQNRARQYSKNRVIKSVKPKQGAKQQNQPTKQQNIQQNQSVKQQNKKERKPVRKTPVRIIPLGGLGEIGKNITCFECGQDMFIVDCGMAFPDSDMLGVDLVLPDYSYIEQKIDHVRGLFITHGHEDHIGGVPYFLKKFNVPVYATKLTIGLIEEKLKEHNLLKKANLNLIQPRQIVKAGCMAVEAIRVNHSIPDSIGFAIHTPAGVIIHTGDFKVDYTPIEGEVIDIARFSELGSKGVLLLMSDSTNAERPGYTMAERKIGESFEKLFESAGDRRIIVASFASNIHRVQQIIDSAKKCGRKVAVSGRSMENVVAKAMELGYLNVPDDIMIGIDAISRYPHKQMVLITTGSQGEPMSALSRMASGDHRNVKVTGEDFIIISASPIPGNEKDVTRVINELMRLGAKVIYSSMYEVHTSGHACEDELKMMLSMTKPKFFMPVHGEYKHQNRHAEIAQIMGIAPNKIHIGDIGQVIEMDGVDIKVTGHVPSGRVLVDGLGVGDVGSIVLRDRKILSQDGLIIVVATIENESGCLVAGPDLISRGFVYVRESEKLLDEARQVLNRVFSNCHKNNIREWNEIKTAVRDELSNFIYRKTKRSPMILPIIMNV